MQGHKGSFQREKSSRQKNTRKTKKQKTNKQTKKNTRLNKYIKTPRFVKLQFHFRLWLALSSHGNYKTSKVNVIQNWGLLLSSTCKMPWILPSLIYKWMAWPIPWSHLVFPQEVTRPHMEERPCQSLSTGAAVDNFLGDTRDSLQVEVCPDNHIIIRSSGLYGICLLVHSWKITKIQRAFHKRHISHRQNFSPWGCSTNIPISLLSPLGHAPLLEASSLPHGPLPHGG